MKKNDIAIKKHNNLLQTKQNKFTKNNKKSILNSIKTIQKQEIFKDFVSWIDGIQEDEPVPYEVKYIYFILELSNNDIALSYTGSDKQLKIFERAMYSPLEGEYLFSTSLKQLAKEKFEYKKNISNFDVFEMLKNIIFAGVKKLVFLKNKEILFGYKFDKIT